MSSFAGGTILLLFGQGAGPAAAEVDVEASITRDDRVLLAMRDRLRETNRFVRVDAVTGPKDIVHGSDIRNYAMLWFERCDDLDSTMSFEEPDFDHKAEFTLAIGVHEDDPTVRLIKLGELKAVADNTINGRSFIDGMIPHLTLLRRTRRDRDVKPIDSVWLVTGEYAWIDEGYAGRDEWDDLAPPGYDPEAEPPPEGGAGQGAGDLLFAVDAGPLVLTDGTTIQFGGAVISAADDQDTFIWAEADGKVYTDPPQAGS